MKFAGELDFKVGRLECLYFCQPQTPMDQWQWRMLIRVPQEVKAGHQDKAASGGSEIQLSKTGFSLSRASTAARAVGADTFRLAVARGIDRIGFRWRN
jgi:hypothetical protein